MPMIRVELLERRKSVLKFLCLKWITGELSFLIKQCVITELVDYESLHAF